MSPLAFDKQGKPFAWHRRTRKLLVRMFRNPAARGTCCQVLDAEGNPLYIDAETEYSEFRKQVGNVPGLYRLDQCDDDGVEIDDAQAAYVSIDLTRNASPSGDDGDVNPLVVIEHMFAIHADVMKTMAMQQASIMAASAEILRAPFRPPAPAVEREPREVDDEDEDYDELEPDQEPDPWAAWRPMLKMATPALNKLGELLFAQFVAFIKKSATPPAAAPSSPPVAPPASAPTDASSVDAAHAAAAAGSSTQASSPASGAATSAPASSVQSGTTPSPSAASSATAGSAAASSTTAPASVASTTSAMSPGTASATTAPGTAPPIATPTAKPPSPTSGTALTVVPEAPRNSALSPTPDEWEHLHEIRERLSPKERAIAENAIMRMDADVLAHYLAELAAQSVDDAVATIRSMIATLPTRGRDRGER